MSGSLNRVTLIGHVGQDPEIKHTQGGNAYANLSLATSESWRDKQSGERKEQTEWHRIVIWNEALVKIVDQYVGKGDKLLVEGKMKTRKWQHQDGKDRYSTEVVLQGFDGKILMLSNKRGGGNSGGNDDFGLPGSSDAQEKWVKGGGGGNNANPMDDEIPFAPEWR